MFVEILVITLIIGGIIILSFTSWAVTPYLKKRLDGITFDLDKVNKKLTIIDNHLNDIEKQINDIQSKNKKAE